MHEETLRELVDGGSSILGSLVKEVVVHNNRMDAMERKKELELELAKVKHDARDGGEPPTDHDPVRTPTNLGPELTQVFEDLRARETCHTCRLLLEEIEAAPPDVQVRALTEWGRFKQASEAGASEAVLRDIIESSDTLEDLLDGALAG